MQGHARCGIAFTLAKHCFTTMNTFFNWSVILYVTLTKHSVFGDTIHNSITSHVSLVHLYQKYVKALGKKPRKILCDEIEKYDIFIDSLIH